MKDLGIYIATLMLCFVACYHIVRWVVASMPAGWSGGNKYIATIPVVIVIIAAMGLHRLVLRALKIND